MTRHSHRRLAWCGQVIDAGCSPHAVMDNSTQQVRRRSKGGSWWILGRRDQGESEDSRLEPAPSSGPPNGPVALRISSTLHGVTEIKRNPVVPEGIPGSKGSHGREFHPRTDGKAVTDALQVG
jgi:hypothetical protein